MTVSQALSASDHSSIWSLLPEESTATEDGELVVGGCRAGDIAAEFGTPVMVIDEEGLRRQARRFIDGLGALWPRSEVLFASKALPCVAMYALAQSEGLSVDVAGGGELIMALAAGVDPQRIYLHGNAKSDDEIQRAVEAGIAAIVVDNTDDLDRIERYASSSQPVIVRIIPGIDADTHESQATGGHDSKFGLPLDQAAAAIERIHASAHMDLLGIHLHIGSQIMEAEPFADAVRAASKMGSFDLYDIGGGLGVRYTYAEEAASVEDYVATVAEAAHAVIPPDARLLIEPGRSLVARAALTLYRVTTVKRTGRTFVAVDGGMADNLEVSLTGQRLEAVIANRMNDEADVQCDVVGRQCESGDRLIAGIDLPSPVVGDLLAVPVTGAYSYTMANNYNGARKLPIVFCRDGVARLVVARETYDDLLRTQAPALGAIS